MRISRVEIGCFQLFTFQRYDVPGNIDDVVDWDDENEVPENDDFDENMEDTGNDIGGKKENIGDSGEANLLTIEVSSDDEQQKEFFNVFQKVFEI